MGDDYSIEKLLAKATNPLDPQPDKEAVKEFCNQINKEEDGYQTALRFLAHKIQSPQEREALYSLLVLEECVTSCGASFHSEVGKFRFLNELIKVVSPKYLGNRASPKVKTKVIELMFKWSVELKQEPKIFEAYQMLKRQGVVTEDPVHIIQHCEPPPAPRAKTAFFEDEETSEMLQKLLRSRNPQDLQAANRLIKNMVKDADRRMERTARRITELEMGQNNAKVLSDMLFNYKSKETSPGERELMKDLFDCCERLRPKLFRLAGEMDEKDEGLGDILKASDNLTTVINTYKKLILGQDVGPVEFLADRNHKSETSLLDLASPTEKCGSQRVDSSLLDDQLLALGLSDSKQSTSPRRSPSSAMNGVKTSSDLDDLDQIFSVGNSKTEISNSGFGILISQVNGAGVGSSGSIPVSSTVGVSYSAPVSATPPFHVDENVPKLLQPINTTKSPVPTCATENTDKNSVRTAAVKGLEELDVLSQSLLKKSLPANAPTKSEFPSAPHKIPMNLLPKQPQVQTPSSPSLLRVHHPQDSSSKLETENRVPSVSPSKVSVQDVLSLADITVPLQSIQPGETPSLTLQEKNGLTVIVHFGKDSPRADVTVMVVSTMSRNSCPVKSFNFQAAVPKTMRIKLQPPSATDLPPYNPILPPAAITQVMLLANPNKEKVRLKYKVMYIIEEQTYTDIGEVYNLLEHR